MTLVCSNCEAELRPFKNGVEVVTYAEYGPCAIWEADEWYCALCGFKVITGFGYGPLVRADEEGFDAYLGRINLTDRIRRNRGYSTLLAEKLEGRRLEVSDEPVV